MRRLGSFSLVLVSIALAATLGFIAGMQQQGRALPLSLSASERAAPVPARAEESTAALVEAWRVIERNFDGDPTARQELIDGAIAGMVAALNDPQSAYIGVTDMASERDEADGALQSLGLALEKRGGQLMVVAPLTSSPAQRAGIHPGDRIALINGRDTASIPLGEAIALLRGPSGSSVDLTIIRPGSDPLTLTVPREAAAASFVQGRVLDGSIAYVNIAALGGNVSRDLAAFLKQTEDQSLAGMILDLRNNPGGYLDAAIELTGYFISDGLVVSERSHGATTSWSYADDGRQLVVDGPDGRRLADIRNHPLAPKVPLVVLVNRGTASAAEVLAAALQDHGRAVLAGEPTYGKGSVTGDFDLSGGGRLHLTIGQWQSPKGRSVAGRGLTPDIRVEARPGSEDAALETAVDYIGAQH